MAKKAKRTKKEQTYATISNLVLSTFKKDAKINKEDLEEKVKKHFPESKWKNTHYYWYRQHIKDGRYTTQFNEKQLKNIFGKESK